MGKLERHLNLGEKVEIDGDEFIIKAPSNKSLPTLFKVLRPFKDLKEGQDIDMVDMMAKMDDEAISNMEQLVIDAVHVSFPEEPEEQRVQFAKAHFMSLLPIVMKLVMPGGKTNKEGMDRLKRLMEPANVPEGNSGTDTQKASG